MLWDKIIIINNIMFYSLIYFVADDHVCVSPNGLIATVAYIYCFVPAAHCLFFFHLNFYTDDETL